MDVTLIPASLSQIIFFLCSQLLSVPVKPRTQPSQNFVLVSFKFFFIRFAVYFYGKADPSCTCIISWYWDSINLICNYLIHSVLLSIRMLLRRFSRALISFAHTARCLIWRFCLPQLFHIWSCFHFPQWKLCRSVSRQRETMRNGMCPSPMQWNHKCEMKYGLQQNEYG